MEEPSDTPLTDAIDRECAERQNYPRGPYQMLCRQLEKANAELKADVHHGERVRESDLRHERPFVPGMWKCPQCGFVQQNNTISPAGVFANTKPELRPCPNDGRDLQPVTWKEYADEADKTITRLLNELEVLKGGAQ